MLTVALVTDVTQTSARVILQADKPEDLTTPAAKHLALETAPLGGQKTLDPFVSAGTYPVDADGVEVQFGQPCPAGMKHRADFVVNSR